MFQLKVGAVVFTHAENFKGEVEIARGDVVLQVPMEALAHLVAEKIRAERIAALERAKPVELLSRIV